MKYLTLLVIFAAAPGWSCELQWTHPDTGWLDGFAVFQDGEQVGAAAGDARSGTCGELGLVPGPGPVTMTAFRGDESSARSDPAVFELTAPGVKITVAVP